MPRKTKASKETNVLADDLTKSLLEACIPKKDLFKAITGLDGSKNLKCKPLFCSFSSQPIFLGKMKAKSDAPEEVLANELRSQFPLVYYTYGIKTIIKNFYVGPIILGFYGFHKIHDNYFFPVKPLELVTDYEEEVPYFIQSVNEIVSLNSNKFLFIPDPKYKDEDGAMNSMEYFSQMKLVGETLAKKW
jgi:hypothetical protein